MAHDNITVARLSCLVLFSFSHEASVPLTSFSQKSGSVILTEKRKTTLQLWHWLAEVHVYKMNWLRDKNWFKLPDTRQLPGLACCYVGNMQVHVWRLLDAVIFSEHIGTVSAATGNAPAHSCLTYTQFGLNCAASLHSRPYHLCIVWKKRQGLMPVVDSFAHFSNKKSVSAAVKWAYRHIQTRVEMEMYLQSCKQQNSIYMTKLAFAENLVCPLIQSE